MRLKNTAKSRVFGTHCFLHGPKKVSKINCFRVCIAKPMHRKKYSKTAVSSSTWLCRASEKQRNQPFRVYMAQSIKKRTKRSKTRRVCSLSFLFGFGPGGRNYCLCEPSAVFLFGYGPSGRTYCLIGPSAVFLVCLGLRQFTYTWLRHAINQETNGKK